MNIIHLTDEELDRALVGEDLPAQALEHLAGCVACRLRRDRFLAAVEAARAQDPGEATRELVRGRALRAMAYPAPRRWVRWALAAAAAIVLGLLPLLRARLTPPPPLNADRVLVEVDKLLDSDPLESMASADVVEAVVPVSDATSERSTS